MASGSWFWAAAVAARRSSSLSGPSSALLGASLIGSTGLLIVLPTTTTITTTKCESATFLPPPQHPQTKKAVLLQPRMTSMGRFAWLSETDEYPSVPTFVVALVGGPFTTKDFERAWQRRDMSVRHARFDQCIRRGVGGTGAFVPTLQPLAHHVTETLFPSLYRVEVKDRLVSILTRPYPVYDRLWNVQLSTGGAVGQSGVIPRKVAQSILTLWQETESSSTSTISHVPPPTESLIVFSAHHALADGVSLSAAFSELCDEGPELQAMMQEEWQKRKSRHRRLSWWQKCQRRIQSILGFWWGCLRSLGYQGYIWLASPRHNPLEQLLLLQSKADGPKHNDRRTLSWSQVATVDEMKRVAQFFGDKVTVNDVLVSCVSAAIAKLLQHHRQHLSIVKEAKTGEYNGNDTQNTATTSTQQVQSINVVIPVHLGGGVILPGQSLGNKIGAMLARVPCEVIDNGGHTDSHDQSSVHRLQQIHSILGHVKQSPTALLSYVTARTLASPPVSWILPSSFISSLFSKTHVGATCVITNVRGPPMELHMDGRRVVTVQTFLPLPPGIPMGVSLFSYAGVMNVSVNAQAWAVPNADQFLLWVVEEYQRLLDISTAESKE